MKVTKKQVIVEAEKYGWQLIEKKHKFYLEDQIAQLVEADSLKEIWMFILGFRHSL